MSRYVVTDLEGYRLGSGPGGLGLSCQVIDSECNRNLVAIYRSEDQRAGRRTLAEMHARTRTAAAEHAARLNAL